MELKQATLTVTPDQLAAILAGLDELPGKLGRALYAELTSQVRAQMEAHAAPPKLEAVGG